MSAAEHSPLPPRQDLRKRLLLERAQFHAGPAAAAAQTRLAQHLASALAELEPECLGLYWPIRSEFNAALLFQADEQRANDRAVPALARSLALPFVRRVPPEMHFRAWDGREPALRDETGIRASDGAPVVPDVVLVPCVGFTPSGFRLGYGGGYFDRWMAAHPHATAIGVSWALGALDAQAFAPEPHDRPLAFIVTEEGVV